MARSTKTQQDTADKTPETPSPEEVAQHFMHMWQDQWQGFLQNAPAMAADWQKNSAHLMQTLNTGGFGFPTGFGQHPNHGAPQAPSSAPQSTAGTSHTGADALELATAALAASEQCLELLKQCGQWMDGINQRITALEQYAAAQPGMGNADAHAAQPFGKPAKKRRTK